MRRSGWMRLASLLFVLTALTALARLGSEPRSLSAQVPETVTTTPEPRELLTATRWTADQLSSLQDVSDEALRAEDGTRPEQPPEPRRAPAAGDAKREPAQEEARTTPVDGPPNELPDGPSDGPPVFYRPSDKVARKGSGPVCRDLRGTREDGEIVFPLQRRFFYSYEDTWGAPREQGGHEGTDLMSPSGVPEYAITDGTVVPVAGSDARGWNTLGGHAVMLRADYSIGPVKKGDLFYYAHLERKSPLGVGTRVQAGQVVGYAGDTGQGPPGTSGLFPPHLHLGWYDGTGNREEAGSGAMNPFPLLEWIKANGGTVTGDSDARFCEAPRSGPPIPSSHDGAWITPPNPGLTPDLDTGSRDPRPVRASERRGQADEPSAKRPSRTDRSKRDRDGSPKRIRKTERAGKPSKEDRTRAPHPEKPDPTDPHRPARPAPGGDQPSPPKTELPGKDPPKPDPPKLDPPESQYDPSTGESSGPKGT